MNFKHLSAAKNKSGTTLRITKKNFQDEELSHELPLTTKEETKTRNAFANNMSTDIKLSKAQLSRVIKASGYIGNMIVNVGKKTLMKLAISLTKDSRPQLAINQTSSVIDKFERKLNR